MDAFLEGDVGETEINSTPNIEFQLDKYNEHEYISKKQIPEEALFVPYVFLNKLKNFYQGNLDIPLLIYGLKGCGKLTAVLGLIIHFPGYLQDIENIYDARKINNLYYMKILDREYEKLLVYENIYYLNIDILSNTTEIGLYLKHIYKIGKSRSIDGGKKVIIIAHIEKCNTEAQKYINFILDKLNANTSYIFTTTKLNNLEYKIKSSCARINFGYLDEKEFSRIFTFNYKTNYNDTQETNNYYKKYVPHFTPAMLQPKPQTQSYYSDVPYTNKPPPGQSFGGGSPSFGGGASGGSPSFGGEEDVLTKKLNYVIHLLEEKQDEKTNNVTEEVILYSFLGVFMIFIVDSFARMNSSSKYTR